MEEGKFAALAASCTAFLSLSRFGNSVGKSAGSESASQISIWTLIVVGGTMSGSISFFFSRTVHPLGKNSAKWG